MTTDKIVNQEEAERFLRAVGLQVQEEVILQVVSVLTSNEKSLYDLYAQGVRKDGSTRCPICGKGTAYKIKRL